MCKVRVFASLCALVVKSTHYRKDGPAMSPMLSFFCAILEILVLKKSSGWSFCLSKVVQSPRQREQLQSQSRSFHPLPSQQFWQGWEIWNIKIWQLYQIIIPYCEWLCSASQSSRLLKTPVQQSNLPYKTWSSFGINQPQLDSSGGRTGRIGHVSRQRQVKRLNLQRPTPSAFRDLDVQSGQSILKDCFR